MAFYLKNFFLRKNFSTKKYKFTNSHVIVALISGLNLTCKEGSNKINAHVENNSKKFTLNLATQNSRLEIQKLNVNPKSWSETDQNSELLWYLLQCQCTPHTLKIYFKSSITQKGLLPQTIAPSIRKEVINNPKIQQIINLGNSILPNGIGAILTPVLIDDEKINSAIREGLGSKILTQYSKSTEISTLNSLNFDHFVPSGTYNQHLNIDDQAVNWLAVFESEKLWSQNSNAPFKTAEIWPEEFQFFKLMRTLSEWQYLFGLSEPIQSKIPGGLTVDVNDSELKTFDPRVSEDDRFLASLYLLKLNFSDALTQAQKGGESWSLPEQSISLLSQSKIWYVAGKAFGRLRPRGRINIASAFTGSNPLFPAETHQIPLAFLPGMKSLLNGPFIDEPSRLLRQIAFLPKSFPGKSTDRTLKADIESTAALILSLNIWITQLSELNDAGLSADTEKKLLEAPATLKKALQFAVQTLLNEFIATETYNGYLATVAKKNFSQSANATQVGQILKALCLAESTHLKSTLLTQKIDGLLHWSIAEFIFPKNNISALNSNGNLSLIDLLSLTDGFQKCYQNAKISPTQTAEFVKSALESLKLVLTKWDLSNQ